MLDNDASARKKSVSVDLNRLIIPNPCDFGWQNMTGDDQRRLCGQCDRHVYNLSAMTADEAIELIESTEGKICGRLQRRCDGTVVTKARGESRLKQATSGVWQFSIRTLLIAIALVAGCCAAIPIIGPPIARTVQAWVNPPQVGMTCVISDVDWIDGEIEMIPAETSDAPLNE